MILIFPLRGRNGLFAMGAICYVALLYGTLAFTPPFFRWLSSTLGRQNYSHSITGFLLLLAVLVLAAGRRRLIPLGLDRLLGLALIAFGYWLIFLWVRVPATRLHTVQYGALVWLVQESLRGTLPRWRAYGAALLLVMVVAAGDESIQAWLSNRNGSLKDVLLDWFSAGLALGAIYLIRDRGRSGRRAKKSVEENEPLEKGAPLRS